MSLGEDYTPVSEIKQSVSKHERNKYLEKDKIPDIEEKNFFYYDKKMNQYRAGKFSGIGGRFISESKRKELKEMYKERKGRYAIARNYLNKENPENFGQRVQTSYEAIQVADRWIQTYRSNREYYRRMGYPNARDMAEQDTMMALGSPSP